MKPIQAKTEIDEVTIFYTLNIIQKGRGCSECEEDLIETLCSQVYIEKILYKGEDLKKDDPQARRAIDGLYDTLRAGKPLCPYCWNEIFQKAREKDGKGNIFLQTA